jgi:hypothetical protein
MHARHPGGSFRQEPLVFDGFSKSRHVSIKPHINHKLTVWVQKVQWRERQPWYPCNRMVTCLNVTVRSLSKMSPFGYYLFKKGFSRAD